jgi:hypothetical protein
MAAVSAGEWKSRKVKYPIQHLQELSMFLAVVHSADKNPFKFYFNEL